MPPKSNLPTRLNNPLSIKAGGLTQKYIDSGDAELADKASDGGNFLKFKDSDTGFSAAKDLLFKQFYKDLDVDTALKTWSNKGYGIGQIAQNIDPTKKVSDLSDSEQDNIIKGMAKREGFKTNYLEAAKEFGGKPNYLESAKEFGGIPLNASNIPQTPSQAQEKYLPGNINIGKTIAANLPSDETISSSAVGAAAGLVNPALISPAMAGVQQLFDPKLNEKSASQNLLDFSKNTLVNEAFGRLFSGMGKVGSEIVSPGSVYDTQKRSLLQFKPTAAQLTGSDFLNLVENAFAKKSKQEALTLSGQLVDQAGNDLIKNLTGHSDIALTTPFKQEANIEKGLESQFDSSKIESTKRGSAAKLIAEANQLTLPNNEVIKGPIIPSKFLKEAQNLRNSISKSDVQPDPNSPLIRALDNIINNNTTKDANGQTIIKPRAFIDMWGTKQTIDDIAYNIPKSQVDFVDTRFRKLSAALNQDIEASMPQWQNNGADALRLFQESKQIAGNRNAIFGRAPIEKALNEETRSINSINQIIANPDELQKALTAGKLQIPDQGGFKYITSNTKKDLQGYEITQLMNKARTTNPDGTVSFDGKKLMDMFNDSERQESYKILFNNKNRGDIQQFFKNIASLDQKGQMGPRPYWMLRATAGGIMLGGGLLSGLGTSLAGGGAILGGTIGLSQLGKLLTNPESARLLVAMAQGGPLNMPTMVAGRVLANVLKNSPITLVRNDNSQVEGKINSEGKFTIPLNQ